MKMAAAAGGRAVERPDRQGGKEQEAGEEQEEIAAEAEAAIAITGL